MHVFKSVSIVALSVVLISSNLTFCDGFKISTHVPVRALEQLTLAPKSFYFIRHGQTDWNIENRLQGQLDIPLNETGRSQALALQDAVKVLDISHVYFSPLSRTFETMRIVCEHIGHIPQTPVLNLMERNFGEWQGEIWDQAAVTRYKDQAPVYGETEQAYYTRVVTSANELLSTCDGHLLMVAHGGVFWSLCQAVGIEYEAINNCCILHFIAPDENNNEWRIEEIDTNMKTLQFKSIYFYTQLDYELMLEWLDSIESVDDYKIEGNDLTLTLKPHVSNEDLLELVAVSDRYGLNVTEFKEYMHADNSYWSSGPKFQVIFPQTNKEQKQQTDTDTSLVCLECTPVSLYTQLDKNNMFEWMERNASFATIVGLGPVTSLYVFKDTMNDESLRDLVGLFKRYDFDMQQLNVFLNDDNKEWLNKVLTK